MALYQLPQPRGPIGGVTVQATHPVFKTNQPEIGRYENEVRQYVPRYVIGARVYIHQGATLQATHPVPPQGQPDQARYAVFSNASRFIVSANIYRHQGVTVQATHPVPPNFTRHEARRFLPDINDYYDANDLGRTPQLDGATRQQTYTFPVNQYERKYYVPFDINRYIRDSGQIDQLSGATMQATSPILPVTTPELSYWFKRDANRVGATDGPIAQLDGATRQPTDPIATTNQPEQIAFDRARNALRFIVAATPLLDNTVVATPQTYVFHTPFVLMTSATVSSESKTSTGGPQIQSTDPIPGVSQPDQGAYDRMKNVVRYLVGAKPFVDAIIVNAPQTYIFPNSNPEQNAYDRPRQQARYATSSVMDNTQGVSVQQTYIFPTGQFEKRYYVPDENRYVEIEAKQFTGSLQQTTEPIAKVIANPHVGTTDHSRYQTGSKRIDETPILDTIPAIAKQPEQRAYSLRDTLRYIVATILPIEGSAVQNAEPIPKTTSNPATGIPDLARYQVASKRIDGPATIVVDIVPIPGVSGVEYAYYFRKEPNRQQTGLGPTPQVSGATDQQTYIFPTNEPEQSAYENLRNFFRRIIAPVGDVVSEGAPSQQTYIFPNGQPEQWSYDLVRNSWRRITMPTGDKANTGATSQQTYVFPVNQPEISRLEAAKQMLRYIVGAKPITESFTQDTPIPSPYSPDKEWWARREAQRIDNRSKRPIEQVTITQQTYLFPVNQPRREREIRQTRENENVRTVTSSLIGKLIRKGVTILSTIGQVAVLKLTGKGSATPLDTKKQKSQTSTVGQKTTLTTKQNKTIT